MKELEIDAEQAVRRALSDVPLIHDVEVEAEPHSRDRRADFIARLRAHRQEWTIVCEVKSSGQLRIVRDAARQLQTVIAQFDPRAVPLLVTPYFTQEARHVCRELGVNYLDLEGNCRISFDGIFIERETASRPPSARRELRSLFKPKSAQVLRVLLRRPDRTWKVTDLATESGVSLGHISNVTSALIVREWGSREQDGFKLTKPAALLDNWRDNYVAPPGEVKRYYTILHGKSFEGGLRELMDEASDGVALASFSAAEWLAPYARVATHYLYARRDVMTTLRNALRAEPAAKGDNLIVTVLDDDGVLRDTLEPHSGIRTTGLVQTYLDLAQAGDRGREAADHLREERLSWPT